MAWTHRPPTWRIVGVGAVLVVLITVGWWLVRPAAPPLEATIPRADAAAATPGGAGATSEPSPAASSTSTSAPAELVVQAAGAVARPGVYRLPAAGRIDDLVRAAGGLTSDADGDRVNLAAPLADGSRVWVPRRGEGDPPAVVAGDQPVPTGPGPQGSAGAGATPVAPVDLNTATAEQLDTLPGVGPATAQAILAHRSAQGPFGSVDDLLEVRGIGEAKLEQLRPLVTV